jgi:predicted ester cyclase
VKKYLSVIPLVLLLCLFVGCGNREVVAELEELKSRVEVEDQNKALVIRFIETFNSGNYDALTEFLSPDYEVYSPSGYPEPTSREKLIENYRGAAEAFAEFQWSIKDLIAAGDKVICRIIISGIYQGGTPDPPPTEKKFALSMISIMRLAEGKIIEEWQEDDQLGFARQLGMELKPKEEEK